MPPKPSSTKTTSALLTTSAGAGFQYRQLTLDTALRPLECQIQICATGVCHADLKFADEKSMPELYPCVLGHEGAGTVTAVGSEVSKFEVGDKVICVFSCCGECEYCQRKETGYCDLWFRYNFGAGRVDGSKSFWDPETGGRVTSHFFGQSSFARDVIVSQYGLVKVDGSEIERLGWKGLAPLGCGVMTGAGGEF